MSTYSYILSQGTYYYMYNFILRKTGLASESNPNAMGEPHNGYAGVVGSGHRVAHRCTTQPQAIWPHEGAHFEDNDEEHHRALNLSAHRRIPPAFPR